MDAARHRPVAPAALDLLVSPATHGNATQDRHEFASLLTRREDNSNEVPQRTEPAESRPLSDDRDSIERSRQSGPRRKVTRAAERNESSPRPEPPSSLPERAPAENEAAGLRANEPAAPIAPVEEESDQLSLGDHDHTTAEQAFAPLPVLPTPLPEPLPEGAILPEELLPIQEFDASLATSELAIPPNDALLVPSTTPASPELPEATTAAFSAEELATADTEALVIASTEVAPPSAATTAATKPEPTDKTLPAAPPESSDVLTLATEHELTATSAKASSVGKAESSTPTTAQNEEVSDADSAATLPFAASLSDDKSENELSSETSTENSEEGRSLGSELREIATNATSLAASAEQNPSPAAVSAETGKATLPQAHREADRTTADVPRSSATVEAPRVSQRWLEHGTFRTGTEGSTQKAPDIDVTRFLQRVARAFSVARQRDGEVRIRLHPPELGALRIELQLNDGQLSARLQAETSEARNALLEHLPLLKERLAEQNIRVERFDVELFDAGGEGPSQWNDEPTRQSPRGSTRATSERNAEGKEDDAAPNTRRTALRDPSQINVII